MSDIQINTYSYSDGQSAKKAEEEVLLNAIKKGNEEKRLQLDQLKEKLDLQKVDQDQSIKKAQEENKPEFRLLEQVAKVTKTEVDKLSSEQLKIMLPDLKKSEAELLQKILESNKLEQLQEKYKQSKLEEAGVKQKFSEEYKVLSEISKVLKIPVDQLSPEDIKKYLKSQQKDTNFVPKSPKEKEPENSSRIVSEKDSEIKQELQSKYSKLKDLLDSLKNKQKGIQSDTEDKSASQKNIRLINKHIGVLENQLSVLKKELKEIKEKEQGLNVKPDQNNEKSESLKQNIKRIRQELASVKDSIGKEKLQEVLSKIHNFVNKTKELAAEPSLEKREKQDIQESKLNKEIDSLLRQKDTQKVEKEVASVTEKIDELKGKRSEIQKQLQGKQQKSAGNRVIENKIGELKIRQNDLKAKLTVDIEIKGMSSKESKKAIANTKQTISEIDKQIKDLEGLKNISSNKQLGDGLRDLSDKGLSTSLIKEIKQERVKDDLLNKILKTENPDLDVKEIKLLGQLKTNHLGLKQLQKFAGVLNRYTNNVSSKIESVINTGEVTNVDFDSRLEYAQNKHSQR